MQRSEAEGITDHLLVHMLDIACVLLIHKRVFNLAQTREKYRTLPCGSMCRGSEDLIDWKLLPVAYLDTETETSTQHGYCVASCSADAFDVLWQFLALIWQNNFRMYKTIATAARGCIWKQNILLSLVWPHFFPLRPQQQCLYMQCFVRTGLVWSFRRNSSPAMWERGHTCWSQMWFSWDKGAPATAWWFFMGWKGLWGRKYYRPVSGSPQYYQQKNMGL